MKRTISRIAVLAVCFILIGVATNVPGAQSKKPPPPASPRFVDNGDGTITDNQTGLMWEKKTGVIGSAVIWCSTLTDCPDPHNVNNRYQWSSPETAPDPTGPTAPDGSLYTNFLARINTELSTSADGITVADVCFAGHCDWRIPNIAELKTILDCSHSPCIDPIFGPTSVSTVYFSSTTDQRFLFAEWDVHFGSGSVSISNKGNHFFARAVRGR